MFRVDLPEQLSLIPGHELETVEVVPVLVELTDSTLKRPLLGRQERRGDVVELGRGVLLQLAERRNLAPELAELFGPTVHATEDLDDNNAEYDQQRCDDKEGPDQLGMDSERRFR